MKTHSLSILTASAVLAAVVVSPGSVVQAKPAKRVTCEGTPFGFLTLTSEVTDSNSNRVRLRYTAPDGMSMLECSNGSMPTVDVMERGVIAVDVHTSGELAELRGRIRLGFTVGTGPDILEFRGRTRGIGPCAGGVCTIEADVRASSTSGGKLQVRQQLTIDLNTGQVTDVDVLSFRVAQLHEDYTVD